MPTMAMFDVAFFTVTGDTGVSLKFQAVSPSVDE